MTRDDGRIPVVFGSATQAGGGDAVVHADGVMPGMHVFGCACCRPRADFLDALGRLFMQQVRGEVSFRRVFVVARDPERVLGAMIADRFVSARFKLPGDGKDLIISPLPL